MSQIMPSNAKGAYAHYALQSSLHDDLGLQPQSSLLYSFELTPFAPEHDLTDLWVMSPLTSLPIPSSTPLVLPSSSLTLNLLSSSSSAPLDIPSDYKLIIRSPN